MVDKNGVEMKTGDVVLISGAFFKNDNGLWFIERSPVLVRQFLQLDEAQAERPAQHGKI